MKNIFKLSLSLLANQFLASVGGFMCIIFVWMLAGDSIWSQIIFLLFTFPFFTYIEYKSAHKYGFHDSDRRNNPDSKKYLYKGAVSGIISSIPLYSLVAIYIVSNNSGSIVIAQFSKLYTRIISMYYNWPMCNIFPNHITEVFLSSLIPLIIIPMIGYIAGYKGIYITDGFFRMLKGTQKHN